jgi:hypothetical protein
MMIAHHCERVKTAEYSCSNASYTSWGFLSYYCLLQKAFADEPRTSSMMRLLPRMVSFVERFLRQVRGHQRMSESS